LDAFSSSTDHLAEARLRSKAAKKVSGRQSALEKYKAKLQAKSTSLGLHRARFLPASRSSRLRSFFAEAKKAHSPAHSLFSESSSPSASSSSSESVEDSAWITGRRAPDESSGDSFSDATDFVTDDDEAAKKAKEQIPEEYQSGLTINQCFEICVQYHVRVLTLLVFAFGFIPLDVEFGESSSSDLFFLWFLFRQHQIFPIINGRP